MEKFVDRIIETDRKARQVIDAAQQEKKRLLRESKARAQADLAAREEAAQQGKKAVDAEMAALAKDAGQKTDEDYLAKKHALDAAFEQHREAWLAEITKAILAP